MARPHIFVSSTYYDLKHLRSSLDNFIETLGFDSVLSEKGDIAYSPDIPLDESCYREASGADIFVLIIGGRYGSSASSEEKRPSRAFFDRYESVTKKEYDAACARDIPVYILIEQNVYSEYHTYLRNRDNDKIEYAHVESVNIFKLIEDILSKPRNNPIHTFERFAEIEAWLREQWSGLFRELLQRMSGQKQISSLSSQVETLSAINSTLQRYLEAVISKVSPDEGKELIESERKRLWEIEQFEALKKNDFFRMAWMDVRPEVEQFRKALLTSESFPEFSKILGEITGKPELTTLVMSYEKNNGPIGDINDARKILGLKLFPMQEESETPKNAPRLTAKSPR